MDDGDDRVCKICDRKFKCGRALGGHMRSHLSTLKLPVHTNNHQLQSKQHNHHYREEVDEDEDEAWMKEEIEENFVYSLRENRRKSFRISDPEFSFTIDASSAVLPSPPAMTATATTTSVHDSQSETEELSAVRRRPTKRRTPHRHFRFSFAGETSLEEPASSISDTSPEEDVAISLMLLSRDCRIRPDTSLAASSSPSGFRTKRRRKFQCGSCLRVFPSYQALGGHRAGHKKSKGGCCPEGFDGVPEVPGDQKIHECPVCFRVFASGQALEGHKRTHVSGAGVGFSMPETDDSMLDLNLPATGDDSTSAVSYAELVDSENRN